MPGRRPRRPAVPRAANARRLALSTRSSRSGMGEGSRMKLDPRTTPARPDLAAEHLKGHVAAARFVVGTELEVRDAQAAVRRGARPAAPPSIQALHGGGRAAADERSVVWGLGLL